MSQAARQVIVLSAAIIAITFGAMVLLLSAISSPSDGSVRLATPTLALPRPTVEPVAPIERTAPVSSGTIALLIGGVSGLLVVMLSLAVLRTRRISQKP